MMLAESSSPGIGALLQPFFLQPGEGAPTTGGIVRPAQPFASGTDLIFVIVSPQKFFSTQIFLHTNLEQKQHKFR